MQNKWTQTTWTNQVGRTHERKQLHNPPDTHLNQIEDAEQVNANNLYKLGMQDAWVQATQQPTRDKPQPN